MSAATDGGQRRRLDFRHHASMQRDPRRPVRPAPVGPPPIGIRCNGYDAKGIVVAVVTIGALADHVDINRLSDSAP